MEVWALGYSSMKFSDFSDLCVFYDYGYKNVYVNSFFPRTAGFWNYLLIQSNFLILYWIFYWSQVKRSVIISNKHGIHELPHELPNDLRLRILGNQEK